MQHSDVRNLVTGQFITVRLPVRQLDFRPDNESGKHVRVHGGSWVRDEDILSAEPAARPFTVSVDLSVRMQVTAHSAEEAAAKLRDAIENHDANFGMLDGQPLVTEPPHIVAFVDVEEAANVEG